MEDMETNVIHAQIITALNVIVKVYVQHVVVNSMVLNALTNVL